MKHIPFIDMLLKTVPHSLRAGAALVVMLGCLWQAYTTLTRILLAESVSAGTIAGFVIVLIVGLAATVIFYYFQSADREKKNYNSLETLNTYHEAEQREKKLKENKATPVFSSHGGEITTGKTK